MAAVARTGAHLDVFWKGANGDIMTTWDDDSNPGVWASPFSILPAGTAQVSRSLTAVARTPTSTTTHMDLFWTGVNGDIRSTWWDSATTTWATPFGITPTGVA